MRPYQPVKHLDSKGDGNGCPTEGICVGRQCTYPCATHYNGGDPRCGSQKSCGNVPSLSLYMFFIEIKGKQKECIYAIY